MAEDWFNLIVAPPPLRRTISAAGARILANQLRDAVWARHEAAVSQVGVSKACPFDLHALVPVPFEILRLGPDHPRSLAWIWEHWGTTWSLRRVALAPLVRTEEAGLPDAHAAFRCKFWARTGRPGRRSPRRGGDGLSSASTSSQSMGQVQLLHAAAGAAVSAETT